MSFYSRNNNRIYSCVSDKGIPIAIIWISGAQSALNISLSAISYENVAHTAENIQDNGKLIKRPPRSTLIFPCVCAVYLEIAELKPHIHTENAIPHKGRTNCSIPIPYEPMCELRKMR